MLDIRDITCCPRCRSSLAFTNPSVRCSNVGCEFSRTGFMTVAGQPVLIDFSDSVFAPEAYAAKAGSVFENRDDSGKSWRTRAWALLMGANHIAPRKCEEMLQAVTALSPTPVVLIIGGGAIGAGTERLYQDPRVNIVGIDVYASPNTILVADAHRLPFRDAAIDGVWIQAVLEHVLEPWGVAAEIHRILKPDGLVYADTPFLQAVHEGAYDYTRFTQSGHRWLFRHFEQIDAGVVHGAGSSLVWAIRYFFRAIGFADRLATLAVLPFFWLRFFDLIARRRPNADAASGTDFFGRKSGISLSPHEIIAYYRTQV